jgi:hypothetical protein
VDIRSIATPIAKTINSTTHPAVSISITPLVSGIRDTVEKHSLTCPRQPRPRSYLLSETSI